MKTQNSWSYVVRSFALADQHNLETVFTQANGYLGIRGYAEEEMTGVGSDPMQFVAGYFDRSPVTRNTMVNIPTLKRIRIQLDGERLDLGTGEVADYTRTLNMRNAVSERSFAWTSPRGRTTKVRVVSFLSYPRWHVHALELTLQPVNWSGRVVLEDRFDGTGQTLHQTHFKVTGHGDLTTGYFSEIRTLTSRLRAVLACAYETSIPSRQIETKSSVRDGQVVSKSLSFAVARGRATRLRRYVGVATDFDRDAGSRPIRTRTLGYLNQAVKRGWAGLLQEQESAWAGLWARADVAIDGDPEREGKLRFSIFQMLQAYRPGDPRLSIGAKFLSGEHYSGHYFWDTDNFLTPFYLFTMPEAAQNLVEYRVRNLAGARLKAKGKKCQGAFYPWEACPMDGQENCPEWWKDKAAKEPIYIPCGNIELHINSAVALAAVRYLQVAGRARPSRTDINRMLVEIARFWASRGIWEQGRFSIKNVIGPDEYHEYVDDNAYTNHTARWCFQQVLSLPGLRGWGVTAKEEGVWRKIMDGLVLGYDPARGILAQDRTFLTLPELDRAKFKPVIPLFRQGLSMEQIGHLQAVKQADVLALFHQLPFTYDQALMQRCWDYYEPRTVHDSNLSAGSHAVVAALLGRRSDFQKYYDKVLNLDIGGESYNVVDGLHAANAGNAWSATIMGAAGIRWTDDALCCTPQLLPGWKALRFSLIYRGRRLDFRIDRRHVTVACARGRAIQLVVAGQTRMVRGRAQTLQVSRQPVGVVFDLDGVLVDSAVCHYRAWKKVADELGVKFDEKKNDLLRGVSRRESMMILLDGQLELPEEKLQFYMAKKNELYKQLVLEAGEALLLPGVKPFLSRLRAAGVKLAVASSSKNTPDLLKQAGLDRYYFDAVADGNDIKNSKPHPEVFQLAARRIGVHPSRCLCVEDAPAGIEAGRRASMKTLGIGAADLGRCDARRDSIAATTPEDIFSLLAQLGRG